MSSMTPVKIFQACVTDSKRSDVDIFNGYVEFHEKQGGVLPQFSKANFEVDEEGDVLGVSTEKGTLVVTKFKATKNDKLTYPVTVTDDEGNPIQLVVNDVPQVDEEGNAIFEQEVRLAITAELFEAISTSKFWNASIAGTRGRSSGANLTQIVSDELKEDAKALYELVKKLNKEVWEDKKIGIVTVYIRRRESVEKTIEERKSSTKKAK